MTGRALHAALCAGLLLLVTAPAARAHELSMAELAVRELAKGQFVWSWGQSGTGTPIEHDLTVLWPDGCSADGQALRCSPERGMVGELRVEGVGDRYSAALVHVDWLDGQSHTYTITEAQPVVRLHGGAQDTRSLRELALAYTVLGIEHILSGLDHVAFVLGLLFLVGFRRKLVLTISAFTLAHSVTLAGSALGLLSLRSPPVEACIALSIMLVAREALSTRETLTKRAPGIVAFAFGLVHGLGFAGALRDVGLPEDRIALPLLTFNLGVELGQLGLVAVAYLSMRVLATLRLGAPLRAPALYALGGMASYWTLSRLLLLGS